MPEPYALVAHGTGKEISSTIVSDGKCHTKARVPVVAATTYMQFGVMAKQRKLRVGSDACGEERASRARRLSSR